jgi:integrase
VPSVENHELLIFAGNQVYRSFGLGAVDEMVLLAREVQYGACDVREAFAAAGIGLRQGELLGLKWQDIDLGTGMLQVRRTLTTAKGGPRFTVPKTAKSRRSVNLTPTAVEALKRHSQRQAEEIMKADSLYRDQGLVFASLVGTPLSRHNLTRSFKALLKRADLSHTVRFHDLRHTCATLLLSKGFNGKFVQELLGHATIAITLDTYSHVMPGMADHTTVMEDALKP